MKAIPDEPEAGREYLRRALAALPQHSPDDAAVWPYVRAQLGLAQAVSALPRHTPDDALWARISSQLAQAEPLPAALTQLPAHTPDDALWEAIAARLDAAAPPAAPPAAPRPWWLRAARARHRPAVLATLALLLLAVGLWRWPRPAAGPVAGAPTETVSYSVEETTEAPPTARSLALAPDVLAVRGEAFIDAHCSALPAVCQSANFQELRGQLQVLTTEETQLADDLRRHGSRPELLRHQSRVTTQKAATTRKLINLLIS